MTLIARHEDGQTAVEYAAVMLFAAIVLLLALAGGIGDVLDNFGDKILAALP